jgi:hypothetical protein
MSELSGGWTSLQSGKTTLDKDRWHTAFAWGLGPMMTILEEPGRANLMARVRGILSGPTREWGLIRIEETSIRDLFTGYACILVAIPSVAVFIQILLFQHHPLILTVVISLFSYGIALLGVFLQGIIFNILAASFGGQKSLIQAMKLAVYSQTAACVAGILNIVPLLGVLVLLAGFYGLYTLWLGLPRLMKVPPDRAVGYVVASAVLGFIVNLAFGMITLVFTRAVLAPGVTG